jgi:hypothetical protein
MKIIGLFGSMRYKKDFFELEKELTCKGYLVLMPFIDGLLHKSKYRNLPEVWENLMNQAFKRIELCDIVLIIGNHIGDHTRREIEFAQQLQKTIKYIDCKKIRKELK